MDKIKLKKALSNLSGQAGIDLVDSMGDREFLYPEEYQWVLNNIMSNSYKSIEKYMGIVVAYYIKGLVSD